MVARFTAPDGRATVALRAPVWLDGAWWTCLDRSYRAGAGFLAPHRHAHTDEVHMVRDGTVRLVQGVRRRTARPGDVVVVPAGTPHVDPWATADGPATVTTLLGPAAPEWLAFGLHLGRATRAGRLTRRGQPPLPAVMAAVHASGADVLAAGLPAALQQRVTTPALAALGRAMGATA